MSHLYQTAIKFIMDGLVSAETVSKYESELSLHSSFLNTKTKLYIGGEEYMEKINQFIHSGKMRDGEYLTL